MEKSQAMYYDIPRVQLLHIWLA